jgi:hypothetical protein
VLGVAISGGNVLLVNGLLVIDPVLVAVLLDLMERGSDGMEEARKVRFYNKRTRNGIKLTC